MHFASALIPLSIRDPKPLNHSMVVHNGEQETDGKKEKEKNFLHVTQVDNFVHCIVLELF